MLATTAKSTSALLKRERRCPFISVTATTIAAANAGAQRLGEELERRWASKAVGVRLLKENEPLEAIIAAETSALARHMLAAASASTQSIGDARAAFDLDIVPTLRPAVAGGALPPETCRSILRLARSGRSPLIEVDAEAMVVDQSAFAIAAALGWNA